MFLKQFFLKSIVITTQSKNLNAAKLLPYCQLTNFCTATVLPFYCRRTAAVLPPHCRGDSVVLPWCCQTSAILLPSNYIVCQVIVLHHCCSTINLLPYHLHCFITAVLLPPYCHGTTTAVMLPKCCHIAVNLLISSWSHY